MTVSNEDSRTGPYNGDGSTTSFDFDFLLLAKSHLVVTLTAADGTSTEQALDVDYTIPDDDVNDPAGGTITMATAPDSGEQLTITREVTRDQEVDLQNRGSFFPETIERALDKLTQITQDHREILDRSIKQAVTETADLTFPQASDGQAIGWDGSSLTNIASVDGATLLSLHEVLGKVPSGADGIFIGEQEVLGRLTGGDLQSLTANDVYKILREQELVPEAGAVSHWQYAQSATYVDPDTLTIAGRPQDLTGAHPYEGAGRRVLVLLETAGTYRWATIDSASYDGVADETTVNLTTITDAAGASATLSNEPLTVWAHIDSVVPDVASVSALQAASFPSGADRLWLRGYTTSEIGVGAGLLYRDASDATSADDGGTVFVDADSGRWKRPKSGIVNVRDFGAVGDGTDQSARFQAAIDSLPTTGRSTLFVPRDSGDYVVSGLLAGSRSVYWMVEEGASVSGTLPGTIVALTSLLRRVSAPQALFVFGGGPAFIRRESINFGAIGSNGSVAENHPVNGIAGGSDRIQVTVATDLTAGIIPGTAAANAANQVRLKWHNITGATIDPAAISVDFTLLFNSEYRQVFSLSKAMDADTWLAGVDAESAQGCIWRTENSGASWRPVYGIGDNAIRAFLHLNASSTVIALTADAAAKVYKSIDHGETWTDQGQLGTALTAFSADLEGGEGSGDADLLIGADANVFRSTDSAGTFTDLGAVKAGYDQVWGLVWLTGSGSVSEWLAFINDSGGTNAPRVQYSNDFGGTWADRSTVGAAGDVWQGILRLASGTLLAATNNKGNIYRSTDNAQTWTLVFSPGDVEASEVKTRAFAEWEDGTVWAITQDGGYLWRSDDEGRTWVREYRLGKLDSPVSLRPSGSDLLMIGCGQGLVTGKGEKAVVYRAVASHWND